MAKKDIVGKSDGASKDPVVLDGSGIGFFISPIGDADSAARKRSDGILNQVLRPSLTPEYVKEINRADDYHLPAEVTSEVVMRIRDSSLIVADVSDNNPNVFYELALAHALGKPTIIIKSVDSKLAFDISTDRTITYSNTIEGTGELASHIKEAAEAIRQEPERINDNPVGRTINLGLLKSSDDPEKVTLAQIARDIQDIKRFLDDRKDLRILTSATDRLNKPLVFKWEPVANGHPWPQVWLSHHESAEILKRIVEDYTHQLDGEKPDTEDSDEGE